MMLWPTKPLLVMATFAVLVTAPQFIPSAYNWRIFEWNTVPMVLDFEPRKPAAPAAAETADLKPEMVPVKNPSSRILDPGDSLASFFAALYQAEQKKPGTRVRILTLRRLTDHCRPHHRRRANPPARPLW